MKKILLLAFLLVFFSNFVFAATTLFQETGSLTGWGGGTGFYFDSNSEITRCRSVEGGGCPLAGGFYDINKTNTITDLNNFDLNFTVRPETDISTNYHFIVQFFSTSGDRGTCTGCSTDTNGYRLTTSTTEATLKFTNITNSTESSTTFSTTFTAHVYYNIGVRRINGTFYFFKDGVLLGTKADSSFNYSSYFVLSTDANNAAIKNITLSTITNVPTISSISASPNPIKSGNQITITPSGQADVENDTLYFYCNETGSATSANTLCSQGSQSYSSPYNTMTCTYNVSGDVTKTVYCRIYGQTDNYSSQVTTQYTVDSIAPTTSFSGCNNQWNNSNQTITLSCSDGSGVGCRNTRYRIDSGSWANYPSAFVLNTDGNHQVDMNSDDVVDNQESPKTFYCAIDKTAPVTTSDANNNIWQAFDANVHLSVNCNVSGCLATKYRVNSGAWQTFDTNILITAKGTNTLDFNSTDNAGNIETTNTKYVLIDKTDANIWQVEGNDFNATLPMFSYAQHGILTITWWAKNLAQKDLNANLWHGATQGAKTTKIFSDFNMSIGNGCSSNNSSTGIVCSQGFNISGLADANYWLVLDINNGTDVNSMPSTKSFGVDNTAPSSNSVSVASFSGIGKYTYQNPQTLTLASTGATSMAFSCNDSTYGSYVAYATSYSSFNVRTGSGCTDADGNKTVYTKFKDDAGNVSASVNTGTGASSFVLDTANPTFSSIAVSSFSGATGYTSAEKPPFALTASDSGGLYDMNFSCNNATFSSTEAYAATKTDFNVASGAGCSNVDGNKTVYARIRDRAYNVGTANTTSFVLDRTNPTLSGALPSSNATIINPVPDFNVSFTETNIFYCRTRPFKNNAAQADTNATISGGKCLYSAFPSLEGGNTMLAQFTAFDLANNFSTDLNTAVYTYASLDFNIWQADTRDLNASGNFYYSYFADKNLTIRFWANDAAQRDKNANLWHSPTKYSKQFLIFGDLNLSSNNGLCDGNGAQQVCARDFNIFGLGDGNYWFTLEIRGGTDVNFVSSPRSVFIDNNAPSVSWDGNASWQKSDTNIHLACQDGTGSSCSVIKFRKDSNAFSGISLGDWTTFDANILFAEDGNWAIDFNATDRAGNIGDTNRFYLLLDRQAPTLDDNIMSVAQGAEVLANSAIVFYIDVNDSISGLISSPLTITIQKPDLSDYNYTMVLKDSNTYKLEYSGTSATGTYRAKNFYATDNAGNINNFSTNMYFTVSGGGGGGGAGGGGGGGGGPPIVIEKPACDLNFSGTNCGANCVDNYFVYLPFDETQKSDTFSLKSSCPIQSCEVGALKENFSCFLDSNNSFKVKFDYNNDSGFSDVLKTEIMVTSSEGRTVFVSFTRRTVNFGVSLPLPFQANVSDSILEKSGLFFKIVDGKIVGVRLWWIGLIIAAVFSIAVFGWAKRRKK